MTETLTRRECLRPLPAGEAKPGRNKNARECALLLLHLHGAAFRASVLCLCDDLLQRTDSVDRVRRNAF